MSTGHEAALFYDLQQARRETARDTGCPLCRYIAAQGDDATRGALRDAAAGTIGIAKLERVLRKHEARDPLTNKPVGRRTITRHRDEEHRP